MRVDGSNKVLTWRCKVPPQSEGVGDSPSPAEVVRRSYFIKWSAINAASSAGSTTPSRVRSSLPLEKKCVVG